MEFVIILVIACCDRSNITAEIILFDINNWDRRVSWAMKKIFINTVVFMIAIVILMTLFSACGKSGNEDKDSVNNVEDVQSGKEKNDESANENLQDDNSQNDNAVVYPITIKDDNGFEFTLNKKPEKIVSLTLGTDEILLALVEKDRIAALSELAVDKGLSNVVEEAEGFTLVAPKDIEKIIALQPDLVFVADWTDANVVQQLRDAGLNVYGYKSATNIDEQKKVIETIAYITGEVEKGKEIIAQMDSKLKYIEEKVKNLKDEEKLKALNCDAFFCTYGKNTTFDELAKHAGVINLAAEIGIEGYVQISKEKIIELNPDVLILPSWSFGGFDADEFYNEIKNDKSLQNVNAVKNNRVFSLPDSHTLALSQYIVLGVEDLAKAVYPELFEE